MKEIILLEPILATNGSELRKVLVNLITFGQYKLIVADAGDDELKKIDLLIQSATGLPLEDIEKLKTPDFNALEFEVIEMTTRPAEFFLKKDDVEFDVDKPTLLKPLGDKTALTLTSPTVKASRMMGNVNNTEKAPFAQSEYITKACADLMDHEIDELSVPDWNQLQNRINDFLNQASGFFR